MQKITYDAKAYINENPSVPAINKVQAADMNEIKTVVNTNADATHTWVELGVKQGNNHHYHPPPELFLFPKMNNLSSTLDLHIFNLDFLSIIMG